MLNSSATRSSASMLAAVSGLCRERKSETSILANPSDRGGLLAVLLSTVGKVWAEEEAGVAASNLTSPSLEEDSGRWHEDDEVAGWCGGSGGGGGGCGCGGGGGSGGLCCAATDTVLFELLSLGASLQAQWHWQDSSCLMMMTGRLRPICWTELPERERMFKYSMNYICSWFSWQLSLFIHLPAGPWGTSKGNGMVNTVFSIWKCWRSL